MIERNQNAISNELKSVQIAVHVCIYNYCVCVCVCKYSMCMQWHSQGWATHTLIEKLNI